MKILEAQSVSFSYPTLWRRKDKNSEIGRAQTHPVLSNVTFTLQRGEVLAIVGGNGCGKTTLLKILSGVLRPSSGALVVEGTVAPLIELGAGFEPELSVTENVILYSALLGMPVSMARRSATDVLTWAGLESVASWPLRTLSAGMTARLAFSVATSVQSEIVLVDEVLSVGDIDFQRKSRARMTDMLAGDASVVLVSHDLGLIRDLAQRAMWLEAGRVRKIGPAHEVLSAYQASQD